MFTLEPPLQPPLGYYFLVPVVLGIQQLFYGYVYHFPHRFIQFLKEIGCTHYEHWVYFERIFLVIKTVQHSVGLFDLLLVSNGQFTYESIGSLQFVMGVLLVTIGQILNFATFSALGRKGVFYGSQLGYSVKYVTCFPFNMGISDPQYIGVIVSVFGVYIAAHAESYFLPYLECALYMLSIFVLENQRGRRWLDALGWGKKL